MRPMQREAALLDRARGIEHAQLDRLGVVGEDDEVDTAVARQRAHGFGPAFVERVGQGVHQDSARRNSVASGGSISWIECARP